jgi:pyruvate ferredoxin oxidoreductase alpha subunit
VGLVKIRSFRPFPAEDIAAALKNVKAFAAMDKSDSFNGHCGPIGAETAMALGANGVTAPKMINYIYGLGGPRRAGGEHQAGLCRAGADRRHR